MLRDWASISTRPEDVDQLLAQASNGASLGEKGVDPASLGERGVAQSEGRGVDLYLKACVCGVGPWDRKGVCETCKGVDIDRPFTDWVDDPRTEQEPWRRKHRLQLCEYVSDEGQLCGLLIRGSDRCWSHKRRCWGQNRKGEPCESPPLKGTWEDPATGLVRDIDWCSAHPRPEAIAQAHPLATAPAFGSPERSAEAGRLGGLARRYPRLTEEVQRQIEERAGEIVGAGIEALQATKPVVVERTGRDDDGRPFTEQEVVEYPDHLVRLKAHEALTNRAFGRPHQAVDVNQETRQLTLQLDATDPAVRDQLHGFLRQRPAVSSDT